MSFKVGDRVHCKHIEEYGVIIEYRTESHYVNYPIVVKFQSGIRETYTIDGRWYKTDDIVLTHAIDKKINKILSI